MTELLEKFSKLVAIAARHTSESHNWQGKNFQGKRKILHSGTANGLCVNATIAAGLTKLCIVYAEHKE
jgi:hypothetical protein